MNVVLVVSDDSPFDAYDYLPYLTSWPRGHWVRFPQSIITSPLCSPSRASILTGLYAERHGVVTNDAAPTFTLHSSLGAVMQRAGYRTSLIGKYLNWTHPAPTWQAPGWHDWHAYYPLNRYLDYGLSENGTLNSYGSADADYATDVLSALAVDFVESASEPFFLYLPYYAPHGLAVAATRHATLYDDVTPEQRPNYREADRTDKPAWLSGLSMLGDSTLNTLRRGAYRALKAIDEGIEDIVDALVAKGVFDRTVIIYMTDNSNCIGEHGYNGKECAYEEAIAAQMAVRWPGAYQREDTSLVANIDIAPTIAAVAGTRLPWAPDGMDFGPLVRGEITNWRSDLYLSMGDQSNSDVPPWRGIRTATAKYVEYTDSAERERYDLAADPYELVNLASQGDAGLAARLAAIGA